jgi:hypothetical protein
MSAAAGRGGATKNVNMRRVHTCKLADRAAQHNRVKDFCSARPARANQLGIGCLDDRRPLCKAASGSRRIAVHDVETTLDELTRRAFPAIRSKINARAGRPLRHSEAGMTTFDKREEGFEKKFAVDEEMKFKANARRNKLLGLWAAEKLGISGAEADAYAKAVVLADLEEAGDDDVFRKIRKDFDAKGVKESDHQIRRTMDELMAKAIESVKAGK